MYSCIYLQFAISEGLHQKVIAGLFMCWISTRQNNQHWQPCCFLAIFHLHAQHSTNEILEAAMI